MKLIVKFNLVFLLIFAVGLTIAAYISRDLLERNARDDGLVPIRPVLDRIDRVPIDAIHVAAIAPVPNRDARAQHAIDQRHAAGDTGFVARCATLGE